MVQSLGSSQRYPILRFDPASIFSDFFALDQ